MISPITNKKERIQRLRKLGVVLVIFAVFSSGAAFLLLAPPYAESIYWLSLLMGCMTLCCWWMTLD